METTETVNVKKSRQVRITFTEGIATVNVTGSDDSKEFDMQFLSDEIKTELLHYGWKQKVSDFRASDKLQGVDKLDAISECHDMLLSGEFTQKRAVSVNVITSEQIETWREMSDKEKDTVRLIAPTKAKKLDQAIEIK